MLTTWIDLEGIVQSEIRERHIPYNLILMWYPKTTKPPQIHKYRKQIGGCQRWGVVLGEMEEGCQEAQTSGCKSWGCPVQHGGDDS